MNPMHRPNRLLVLLLAALVGTAPAFGAQPPGAGGGKNGGGQEQAAPRQKAKQAVGERAEPQKRRDAAAKGKDVARKAPQPGAHFNDRSRDAVRTYYASAGKGGTACPPGLARKNNGCLPPGQAKKWQVGQPLPAGVVVHPVPQQIVVALPPVPVGHRYVQVAGDILLIAIGTKMVVDGINGLTGR